MWAKEKWLGSVIGNEQWEGEVDKDEYSVQNYVPIVVLQQIGVWDEKWTGFSLLLWKEGRMVGRKWRWRRRSSARSSRISAFLACFAVTDFDEMKKINTKRRPYLYNESSSFQQLKSSDLTIARQRWLVYKLYQPVWRAEWCGAGMPILIPKKSICAKGWNRQKNHPHHLVVKFIPTSRIRNLLPVPPPPPYNNHGCRCFL